MWRRQILDLGKQFNLMNIFKTSWRYLCKTSWRCIEEIFAKTFWRRLQDALARCLEDVLKTFLEDVLKTSSQDVLKKSWGRLENVLKTSWRRMAKTNILVLIIWRRMTKANIFFLINTSSEDKDERRLHLDECLLCCCSVLKSSIPIIYSCLFYKMSRIIFNFF